MRTVVENGELTVLKDAMQDVTVKDELVAYIVDVVRRTREEQQLIQCRVPQAYRAIVLDSGSEDGSRTVSIRPSPRMSAARSTESRDTPAASIPLRRQVDRPP